jgi:peptidoglycan/LPS O-acetylase OafA/YrhL
VVLLLYSIFFFDKATVFPGSAALVPCLGTALLIWGNGDGHQTTTGRLLASPYVVKIGLASYSLYLWHWPLMAWGEYTGLMESVESKVLVVLLSFWLGFLSWRFVETPFRSGSWIRAGHSVLLLFLCYVAVCCSIGVWFRQADGFRGIGTWKSRKNERFSTSTIARSTSGWDARWANSKG